MTLNSLDVLTPPRPEMLGRSLLKCREETDGQDLAEKHTHQKTSRTSLTDGVTHPCALSYDRDKQIVWAEHHGIERPHGNPVTEPCRDGVSRYIEALRRQEAEPRYLAWTGAKSGIFSLGCDLRFVASQIRGQNRKSLTRYAQHLAKSAYANSRRHSSQSIITAAVINGNAFGAGFELALSCNLIIAEQDAKLGFPETLFSLFPGMGAYSFLARRIGAAAAERIMTSGLTYSAEQLHAMGIVDVVADPGEGKTALRRYADQNKRRHNANLAVYAARERFNPVMLDELLAIADTWVDTALQIASPDVALMERIGISHHRQHDRA